MFFSLFIRFLYVCICSSVTAGREAVFGFVFACLDRTNYFASVLGEKESEREREDKIHLMSIYTIITTLFLLWLLNSSICACSN